MSKNFTPQKFIVCCALPYANGGQHLGHLAGAYLPGDIFTRYKRMQGHDVHFLCGTDEHGAAITFKALEEKITPRQVVDKYHKIIKDGLTACDIHFDIFSRTTHPCHIKRSQEIFLNLHKKNLLEQKTEMRLHCSSCNQFLPDRYVMGTCPSCKATGARGDQCEKCGVWYEPEALIDPICQLCKKNKAALKETSHWYLKLNELEPKIRSWLESKTEWRKNVLGYAFQPLKSELTSRAITRDLEWGVPVPLPNSDGKVLYVWFDAPIGYISASEDWSIELGKPDHWRTYWEDKNAKLVHFIGKDNIIFHTVVWPAVLMGDERYILPDMVCGNEFLNLEGEKFSTSRNYALWINETLEIVPVDLLRYYLTAISPESSDSNFSWDEYQSKINTELADIIGNLINRTLTFINKNFDGQIGPENATADSSIEKFINETVKEYSSQLDEGYSKFALNAVTDLGRKLNVYFQEQAPWKTRKEDPLKAHNSLYSTCVGIKAVALLLYPICPGIAQRIWTQLGFAESIMEPIMEPINELINKVPFSEITNFRFPKGHKASVDIVPIVTKVEDDFITSQKEILKSKVKS